MGLNVVLNFNDNKNQSRFDVKNDDKSLSPQFCFLVFFFRFCFIFIILRRVKNVMSMY